MFLNKRNNYMYIEVLFEILYQKDCQTWKYLNFSLDQQLFGKLNFKIETIVMEIPWKPQKEECCDSHLEIFKVVHRTNLVAFICMK